MGPSKKNNGLIVAAVFSMERWRIIPALYQPTILLLNTIPSTVVDPCRLHCSCVLQNDKTGLGVVLPYFPSIKAHVVNAVEMYHHGYLVHHVAWCSWFGEISCHFSEATRNRKAVLRSVTVDNNTPIRPFYGSSTI